MIQVPNAGALVTPLEGKRKQIFNGLIHYNHFDCTTLDRAAEKAGMARFETISALSEAGKLKRYPPQQIRDALGRERPDLVALHVVTRQLRLRLRFTTGRPEGGPPTSISPLSLSLGFSLTDY